MSNDGFLDESTYMRFMSAKRTEILSRTRTELSERLSGKERPDTDEGRTAYIALDRAFECAIMAEAKYLTGI
jgi:hypothetical protein